MHADPRPHPRRGRARARRSPRSPATSRRGALTGPHQAPRARGAQGGRRRLLQPDPRGLRRRDRPARGRVRRHAAPARAARHGAQAVHRAGVARAAHADLLARRLPRAARGRGARRRDARAVPRAAARPGRAAAQALDRAARPLAAGVRRARAPRPSRRTCASSRARSRRSSRPAAQAHDAPVELHTGREPLEVECDPERVAQVMRILLDNAFVHTPTGTSIRVSAERGNGHVTLEVAIPASGSATRPCRTSSSPSTPRPTARAARGSASPSPASSPSAWRASSPSRSAPGRTAFRLTLPA